jgi:hypothetical protein
MTGDDPYELMLLQQKPLKLLQVFVRQEVVIFPSANKKIGTFNRLKGLPVTNEAINSVTAKQEDYYNKVRVSEGLGIYQ